MIHEDMEGEKKSCLFPLVITGTTYYIFAIHNSQTLFTKLEIDTFCKIVRGRALGDRS